MIPARTPSLAEVFERARARLAEEIHTAIPCEVVRYDSAKRFADVQPMIKSRYRGEDGIEKVEPLPVVSNCPVIFMGGGAFRLVFDLAKGDTVLVVFAEASIDKWAAQGGHVDPVDPRRLALSDGIVIGTLRPASNPWAGDASEGPSLAHDASGCGVHWREDEVRIGSPEASELVALASKTATELTKLQTHFAAFEAVINGPPIPEPGVGAPSALQIALKVPLAASPYPAPASVAATKLKAE